MSFKKDQYTYQESDGQAAVEVVLTGETARDVVVSVMGGVLGFTWQFTLLGTFTLFNRTICANRNWPG